MIDDFWRNVVGCSMELFEVCLWSEVAGSAVHKKTVYVEAQSNFP